MTALSICIGISVQNYVECTYVKKYNKDMLRRVYKTLLELDKTVLDDQRIKALVPIEKYVKSVLHSVSANATEKRSQKGNRVKHYLPDM